MNGFTKRIIAAIMTITMFSELLLMLLNSLNQQNMELM